jgi:catechol 1,2-dioxygenase
MNRRTFVKNSSLTAFSIAAFGSIHFNGKSYVAGSPTTTDILGPFYRPGSPLRSNIIPPGSAGELMHLSGSVFKEDGVTPMSDVLVEVWQVNEKGEYDNTSDDFLGRGAIKTGKNGSYSFTTILPVAYSAGSSVRPAHVHFRISSADHMDLITQIYFKGDPHLQEDSSSRAPESINRILDVTRNGKNENSVRFDVVMRKEVPLDPSVYKKLEGLYQMKDHSMVEFTKSGDLLLAKLNGQIMEGLAYKGNNEFVGGLEELKARFELLGAGSVKVVLTYHDNNNKEVMVDGTKMLKY